MASYEDLVSKARLKVFLDEIKKYFPVSVNGKKQDSNGNIVIPTFTGATSSSNGTSGLIPIPNKGEQDKVLKADGTWYDILSFIASTYQAQEEGKGLSTNDFTTALLNKLNGIAEGANKYSLPTASASTLGGIKVGSGLSMASGVLSATATASSVGGIVAANLAQNGYVKFGNGLILQWGYNINTSGTNNFTWTYPIVFPNKVLVIQYTPQYLNATRSHCINSFNTTSCSLRSDSTTSAASSHLLVIGF